MNSEAILHANECDATCKCWMDIFRGKHMTTFFTRNKETDVITITNQKVPLKGQRFIHPRIPPDGIVDEYLKNHRTKESKKSVSSTDASSKPSATTKKSSNSKSKSKSGARGNDKEEKRQDKKRKALAKGKLPYILSCLSYKLD